MTSIVSPGSGPTVSPQSPVLSISGMLQPEVWYLDDIGLKDMEDRCFVIMDVWTGRICVLDG